MLVFFCDDFNYQMFNCFSSREDAPSMWSFLCSTPENVHTIIQNTLCLNDVGGPLFSSKYDIENLTQYRKIFC